MKENTNQSVCTFKTSNSYSYPELEIGLISFEVDLY